MRWKPVLLAAALSACGDSHAQPDAPAIDTGAVDVPADMAIDANPNMPATLMDTGLCLDAACTQIAPGIQAYAPRWQLWSDAATKNRWIYLPPGTQIDTSDMDFWQFPVGTKIWKEFTRDNIRVETRLIMRVGAGTTVNDWFYVPYVWNATQDATTAEPFGVVDANGTQHDVPSRQQCKTCHENLQPTRILGFSALQLDYDNTDPAFLDLQALIDGGLLTNPPAGAASPHFPMPGNTTTEQPALGYLHANCGHCHNPTSKVYMDIGVNMQLRLTTGTLATYTGTTTYSTTVGIDGTTSGVGGVKKLVTAGDYTMSQITLRFESTNMAEHMPALGSEVMDPTGDTTLRNWITNIQ